MAEVCSLLGTSAGEASLLLRWRKWDKDDLLSRYMEDPDKARPRRAALQRVTQR